jgi:hypothetical protein
LFFVFFLYSSRAAADAMDPQLPPPRAADDPRPPVDLDFFAQNG